MTDERANGSDADDGAADDGAADDGAADDANEAFHEELERARELLDAEGTSAFHVGVVRGDRVDTAFAQRADGPREEGLQALTLLATHLRLVAGEAGVDHDAVAADAASLAGQLDEGVAPDPPDEE
jgi:hypothetical protein